MPLALNADKKQVCVQKKLILYMHICPQTENYPRLNYSDPSFGHYKLAAMYFLLQYLNFTTVGVFATLLLSYCLLLWRSREGNSKIAPEATAAWPIIGHLHLLGGSDQLPHITLGNMADKYGPVFTIRLGVHRALVVSSWEMAKECLTTNDQAASSRPELLASKHLGYNHAMFGFSPYGSYWREVRKIISLELLSNRRLELLKDVRASEVVTSIKELYELWEEKKNESGLVSVEMKQWFGDLTLNVILRMAAGKRYFSASDASENKQAQRCRRVFREFCHLSGLFAVADAIPFLGWLDLGRHEKTLKKTAKEMDSIAQEWLEEHRRRKDSGEVNSTQDFMDVMLSVLDGKNLGDYDADTVNKATCLVYIIGTPTYHIYLHIIRASFISIGTSLNFEVLHCNNQINFKFYFLKIKLKNIYTAERIDFRKLFFENTFDKLRHVSREY